MVVVHTVQDNIHHIRQQLLIQTLFEHGVTEYSRRDCSPIMEIYVAYQNCSYDGV
jgi:hypothetical protein